MKSNNTKKIILSLLTVWATLFVTAQTNYSCTLVSGNDKMPGAVYRLSSVKTGVDVLVSVEKISESAGLHSFQSSGLGASSAFHPELSVAPGCWGYAIFNVQFVKSGTDLPATAMNIPFFGKKYGRIRYSGTDESGTDIRVSVISASKTSFRVRMYATNMSHNSACKKASVAFQKFTYANQRPLLNPMVNLTGDKRDTSIRLKWQIDYPNSISSVIIEKSFDGEEFDSLNEYWVNMENNKPIDFSYSDRMNHSFVHYRLKMISESGDIEYSNMLNIGLVHFTNSEKKAHENAEDMIAKQMK